MSCARVRISTLAMPGSDRAREIPTRRSKWSAGETPALLMYRPDTFTYSLQQRVVASDCELSFLSPSDGSGEPDVALHLLKRAAMPERAKPWYRAPSLTIDETPGEKLLVRFEDETSFLVTANSIELVTAPGHYTVDDIAAYALVPVIAIALHLQGAVLLHASSVVMNGKAIVFAGTSGSGKSTTAAILHRLGYPVLSDDVTELAGTRALASIPAMRLWPDVVHALFGENAVFPDRAPSWDKKLVVIEQAPAAEIAAVLFLDQRADTPHLQRLAPRDAWRRLMANIYTSMLPGEATARHIFEVTSALADAVPMYSFTAPPIENAGTLGEFLERELR